MCYDANYLLISSHLSRKVKTRRDEEATASLKLGESQNDSKSPYIIRYLENPNALSNAERGVFRDVSAIYERGGYFLDAVRCDLSVTRSIGFAK